ncbi:Short-chain dehydrogenase/reductase SDR domain-containing protein [Rozella allomycis CSF55]|uniref:Short-chain dehydrogenase/reductase SDR domain-containing protein n=1 Tax=Rozella allomycis (strain CSF55) TaxID=988480 RepID=A0A075AUB8_ROZAC|nr:Short-chain dehydrogenase/reductase SDR domain-containing protein [Rozella allomycis CSF55]|eukprot:EPZ32322.1 Short-chain dehydrogenase/reductase SDR domain-containing protein [Rozella allomycis CSF55]
MVITQPALYLAISRRTTFCLFDRSGQGHIEAHQLGDLLRSLGYNPTQAQVKEMINKINNQPLSFDSFLRFVEGDLQTFQFPNPTLEELVQVFDKEGNGFISVGELRYVLTSLGEKLTDEEVDEILKQTDVVGKEGFVQYEDYCNHRLFIVQGLKEMDRLMNKVVFITGASSGIGQACAHLFASFGSKLIITARREDKLNELKLSLIQKYPAAEIQVARMDVSKPDSVLQLFKSNDWVIDVLINNAGLALGTEHVSDINFEDVDTVMDTNVKGLLYVTNQALQNMKKHDRGHIINIGSVAGTQAYPGGSIYCASKHAVDSITKSLRMELVDTQIRVTSISPGLVETDFSNVRFKGDSDKAKNVYKGIKALNAEDVAEAVIFAASRPSHVQVADILIFPTNQASAYHVHRQ